MTVRCLCLDGRALSSPGRLLAIPNLSGSTVQLEGNLTKTCGWQAKEMRVNLVRVPQIRAGARKGKYPDIRHLVIKMSYYSPICS